MAEHFKIMTGIDPFTIDQTHMIERSHPNAENEVYRKIVNDLFPTEPIMLVSKEGLIWTDNFLTGVVDAEIIHPRTILRDGRPTWYSLGGTRKPVHPSKGFCKDSYPCLVQAVAVEEGSDAIPVDQIAAS